MQQQLLNLRHSQQTMQSAGAALQADGACSEDSSSGGGGGGCAPMARHPQLWPEVQLHHHPLQASIPQSDGPGDEISEPGTGSEGQPGTAEAAGLPPPQAPTEAPLLDEDAAEAALTEGGHPAPDAAAPEQASRSEAELPPQRPGSQEGRPAAVASAPVLGSIMQRKRAGPAEAVPLGVPRCRHQPDLNCHVSRQDAHADQPALKHDVCCRA